MTAVLKRFSFNTLLGGKICLRSNYDTRGLKYFKPPPNYDHIELPPPEERKLKVAPKVPSYPYGVTPPKMKRMIYLMQEPERVHNKLVHKQFGIQCIRGGRMKIIHFDVIRNGFLKRLDYTKLFARWRVDAPWQACTKRPVGFTLGGGKGNIHHYVTPVSAGRIIVEVAGHAEYCEVKHVLEKLAEKMPFPARAVSHEMLLEEERLENEKKVRNMNPFTNEYLIKNDMLGCRKWTKKVDLKYFGKYPV